MLVSAGNNQTISIRVDFQLWQNFFDFTTDTTLSPGKSLGRGKFLAIINNPNIEIQFGSAALA